MKISKKIIVSVIAIAFAAGALFPLFRAKADGGYVLTFTVDGNHTMQANNGHIGVDGAENSIEVGTSGNELIPGTVAECENNVCTISIESGTPGEFRIYSNDNFSVFQGDNQINPGFQVNSNGSYVIKDYVEPSNNQPGPNDPNQPGPNDPNQPNDPNAGPEPGQSQFDGKAYILWSCESGGICMYHFNDIPSFNDGNSTFYKDTTIVDERTGETFNVNAQYKGWALDDRFDAWVDAYKTYKEIDTQDDIDWSKVDPEDMLGAPLDMREYEEAAEKAGSCTKDGHTEEEFHECVDNYVAGLGIWGSRAQLQPVGEPTDNNAYVSYGDRNFKVVIYNDDYKGITIGDLSDLSYYPSKWSNPFVRQDQFDISGTTASKATYVNTILLEKNVNIKALEYNNFSISKIEALDVPKGAVTVTKKDNGEFNIQFSSNYYSQVTFKVTDSNNEISYFTIKRFTVDAWLNQVEGQRYLYADFYFDENKSYTDYEMTAKIIYKDGSTKNVTLEPMDYIDDGLMNITREFEVREEDFGGKGLKRSTFVYKLSGEEEGRNVKRAYINVEFKGSTGSNYAGAFAGSGKGILANIYEGDE